MRVSFKPFLMCLAVLWLTCATYGGFGFDVGRDLAVYQDALRSGELSGFNGQWLRVRSIAGAGGEGDKASRTETGDREAIKALHERGVKVCVILRWGPGEWKSGVRAGGGHRLPLDLREIYERGRRIGAIYGDIVNVWEIENEPDINFIVDNPETYAAFQKAAYLGLKHGVESAFQSHRGEARGERRERSSTWLEHKRGWRSELEAPRSQLIVHRSSLVIMAPLALPPGPYLERLWANGIASYTDGFNYHYYGYAEDFSGVYGQFRDAVKELAGEGQTTFRLWPRTSSLGQRKTLPVFITEYGYGLLDREARNTVEGRVQQWRWFATVAKQIQDLRIAAPMAFVWNPYYEADLNEFGLMAEKPMGLFRGEGEGDEPRVQSPESRDKGAGLISDSSADNRSSQLSTLSPQLTFTSADFGEKEPQPWMQRIGLKVGDWYASPALAYLWDYAERKPYRPRDWAVRAERPSSVVIDFIAGADMAQRKVSGGYVVQGRWTPAVLMMSPVAGAPSQRAGAGRLVLYNFSDTPVTGRLAMKGTGGVWCPEGGQVLMLAPGERREIDVELAVQAQGYFPGVYRVTFTPEGPVTGRAVWETRLMPDAAHMQSTVVSGFDFPVEAAVKHRRILASHARVGGAPELKPDGRWLVTDGVRVEETNGVWRFHIDYLPAEAMRPAAVELPLPEGFVFEKGTWLSLEQRKVPAEQGAKSDELRAARPELSVSRFISRAGRAGDVMDVYFRTRNGNLFQTWPRLAVAETWRHYAGLADDFTMAFYGRAALPWRFSENRPVSLVFSLRPSQLPAVFEVRGAAIMRSEAGAIR